MSTSPVRCSHFTLGNPKSQFQQYCSCILLIIYVMSEENKQTSIIASTVNLFFSGCRESNVTEVGGPPCRLRQRKF